MLTVAVCEPATAVHGPMRQFFGHVSSGFSGTPTSLSSRAFPSSQVSGASTMWLPHVVPTVVEVVLVELVVVTLVLLLVVVLVELVVGTVVLVVVEDDVLVELVVGTVVLVLLVDEVVGTVLVLVLVDVVVLVDVLLVVVTVVDVDVVGQRKTRGSAASSSATTIPRSTV
jgi:hypothetical protein